MVGSFRKMDETLDAILISMYLGIPCLDLAVVMIFQ